MRDGFIVQILFFFGAFGTIDFGDGLSTEAGFRSLSFGIFLSFLTFLA